MADNEQQSQDASDTEVLFPQHELTIDGETVVVREFTFIEGIRLEQRIQPLLDAFEAGAEDESPGVELLGRLMADHLDLMIELMATACDRDADFVAGLSDSDGQNLKWTFWDVNRRFFLRRIAERQAVRLGAQKAAGSDGAKSSPDSSTTGTTGSDSSDATRDAS